MATTQDILLTHVTTPNASHHSSSWTRHRMMVDNTLAGCVAGVVQVLVGQPFDTVKVRLQTQPRTGFGQGLFYSDAIDCVRKTLSQEGISTFYKGTWSPLAGVGLCTSIQFGVMEAMKRLLSRWNRERHGSEHLSVVQLYLAGAVAGLANSVVSGPVEHVRTRMQVQSKTSGAMSSSVYYSNTLDCARKIFRSHGWRGIYQGQGVTLVREIQGFGGYFAGYEMCVRWMMERQGLRRREALDIGSLMLAGAFGGYCLWLPTFPIDVIKSKLQTDAFVGDAGRRYRTAWDCGRQIYRQEGLKGFYRGFWPCMIRAAPVNAATFLTFELTMRLLLGGERH